MGSLNGNILLQWVSTKKKIRSTPLKGKKNSEGKERWEEEAIEIMRYKLGKLAIKCILFLLDSCVAHLKTHSLLLFFSFSLLSSISSFIHKCWHKIRQMLEWNQYFCHKLQEFKQKQLEKLSQFNTLVLFHSFFFFFNRACLDHSSSCILVNNIYMQWLFKCI